MRKLESVGLMMRVECWEVTVRSRCVAGAVLGLMKLLAEFDFDGLPLGGLSLLASMNYN